MLPSHPVMTTATTGASQASQPLFTVIWQARSQGLHWEEGHFRPPVQACFEQLAYAFDPVFLDYTSRTSASASSVTWLEEPRRLYAELTLLA